MKPEQAFNKLKKASSEKDRLIEKENKRFNQIKEEHQDKKKGIRKTYNQKVEEVQEETGLNEVINKAEKVKKLRKERQELRDKIFEIYRDKLPELIDQKRVTVNQSITIREGSIHRYNRRKNTKLKSLKRIARNLDGIERGVESNVDIVKQANKQIKKLYKPSRRRNSFSSRNIEENTALAKYSSGKPLQIAIVNKKELNRVDKLEEYSISRRTDYFSIKGESDSQFNEEYEGDYVQRLVRNKDLVQQSVTEVHEQLKEQVEETREAHVKIAELFSEQLVAEQL